MNGKGDTPRPISISSDEYKNNWERTFGVNKENVDKKIKNLQDDINAVRDMLDHYSGLPSTQSYDDSANG